MPRCRDVVSNLEVKLTLSKDAVEYPAPSQSSSHSQRDAYYNDY
jgi:hypothetical protein